jgi:ribosomal protein S27E
MKVQIRCNKCGKTKIIEGNTKLSVGCKCSGEFVGVNYDYD